MGKPIAQSIAEIEKAAGHIDYYINKSKEFLATEDLILQTGDNGSVILQPLGPTLVIVPYNFPFWMPFKSALGAIMIGNSIIMKHSTIVP